MSDTKIVGIGEIYWYAVREIARRQGCNPNECLSRLIDAWIEHQFSVTSSQLRYGVELTSDRWNKLGAFAARANLSHSQALEGMIRVWLRGAHAADLP